MIKQVKLLFLTSFCLSAFAVPGYASAAQLIGDCNGDGKADVSDALLTLRYVVGLTQHDTTNNALYLACADVSPLDPVTRLPKGEGTVDIADALEILRHAVNLDTWTVPVNDGAVAEHALAQTGLSIALASNVLQSQIYVVLNSGTASAPCTALNGGGSSQSGATPTTTLNGNPVFPVTVYYDNNCTQPYIAADLNTVTQTGVDSAVIAETATYFGLNGAVLGTMTLNETLAETFTGGNVTSIATNGLGVFTSASGLQNPVQLGLSCSIPSFFSVTSVPCTGGVTQDFPALGLAIGAVTSLTLDIATNASGIATGVTFTGSGATVTGTTGSLTLTNPTAASLVIQGGTPYTTTTASGSAAAFALFPPTPTGWTLTDATHDEKLQISVLDNTVRDLSLTITQVSTGITLVTGTIDQSGTGTINYSNGGSAAITNWTLVD